MPFHFLPRTFHLLPCTFHILPFTSVYVPYTSVYFRVRSMSFHFISCPFRVSSWRYALLRNPPFPPPLHSSPQPHYRPIALCGGRSGAVWLGGTPETLAFPETRGIFGVLGAFRGTLLKWRNLARGFLLPRYFLPFRSFAELGAFVVLGATEISLSLTYVYIFRSVVAKVRQREYRAVGGSLSRRVKGTSLNNPILLW